jgi:hypothetical protein
MTFVQDRQEAWLHRACPRRNILLDKDVFVDSEAWDTMYPKEEADKDRGCCWW